MPVKLGEHLANIREQVRTIVPFGGEGTGTTVLYRRHRKVERAASLKDRVAPFGTDLSIRGIADGAAGVLDRYHVGESTIIKGVTDVTQGW